LGGYVAEKIKFGTTTSGVTADFKSVMTMAHTMVWRMGMGKSGFVGDYAEIPKDQISEEIVLVLNKDTNSIIQDCLKELEKEIKEKKEILDRFAKELLQKEELEYDEIIEIFAEYGYSEGVIYKPLEDIVKDEEDK